MNENNPIGMTVQKNATDEYTVVPNCMHHLIYKFVPRIGMKDRMSGADHAFVRAGNKTGINSEGAPAILPANSIAMNQFARDCIYLEPAWTNAITWSNSFTVGNGYTFTNVTPSVSASEYAIANTDGTPLYATKITATANGGNVKRTISVTNGTWITLSQYVKPDSGNQVLLFGDGTNTFSITYNPSNDSFGSVVNAGSLAYTTKTEPVISRSGWLRLSLTITPKATSSSAYWGIGPELNTNAFYLSAIQKVDGPMRGSYVYTEGSALSSSSEASDTSGNGLSMPLSQAMVDSLKGERIDWSTAGLFSNSGADSAYITVTAADKKIKIVPTDHAVYWGKTSTLGIGATYESSVTITGFNSGVFYIGYGTTSGNQRTANGTYIERFTAAGNASVFFRGLTNSDFTVTINYCRRVLESGQTNPGEGTVLCGVYLPWDSSVVPNSSWVNLITPSNDIVSFLALQKASEGTFFPRVYDGVSVAEGKKGDIGPGYCILIPQYSAALGRMRVGLFNPTTGTLAWSSETLAGATAYRGFFPIYTTGGPRMRWRYGLSGFPVGIGDNYFFNSIITDNDIKLVCRNMTTQYTSET